MVHVHISLALDLVLNSPLRMHAVPNLDESSLAVTERSKALILVGFLAMLRRALREPYTQASSSAPLLCPRQTPDQRPISFQLPSNVSEHTFPRSTNSASPFHSLCTYRTCNLSHPKDGRDIILRRGTMDGSQQLVNVNVMLTVFHNSVVLCIASDSMRTQLVTIPKK